MNKVKMTNSGVFIQDLLQIISCLIRQKIYKLILSQFSLIYNDYMESLINQHNWNSSSCEPERWKISDQPLSQLGCLDLCVVRLYTKRILTLSDRFQVKWQGFYFSGLDIYPQNLSVFANNLIKQTGIAVKGKAQCIFYLRDAFIGTDLRVQISIPGGTKLYVCDQEGEPRDIKTEDFDRCYVSSVLRYINVLQFNIGRHIMVDPFQNDFDKFQQFMSALCRVTRDYDIELKRPLSFEEISKNYNTALRILARYIKIRKLQSWVRIYYLDTQLNASSCIKKAPHMVRFYIQVFISAEQFNYAAQLLSNQAIHQIMAPPVITYYLSKMTKLKDQQLCLLKNISYTNKTEVWTAMMHTYLSNRYTNFRMLSRALIILDILATKQDRSFPKPNPLLYQHRPLSLQKKITFLPQICGYPRRFRSYLDKNHKLKQNHSADSSITTMRTLLQRYYSLSQLKKEIVQRLSKILKAIGKQRFSTLYSQTFQSHKITIDSIECVLTKVEEVQSEGQSSIDMEEQPQSYPSFIAAQLEDRNVHLHSKQIDPSQDPVRVGVQDFDQLEQITEESQRSDRQTIKAVEQGFQQQLHNVRRAISVEFQQLVELSMDIRHCLDQIISKLAVEGSRIEVLKQTFLSLQGSMVVAQASYLCGHNLLAAQIYIGIKKRIVDMYTYHRLLKLMIELKDFTGFFLQLSDLINDFRSLAIVQTYMLPIWVQQELFQVIQKKGRVFVQTVAKSFSNLVEPLKASVNRFQQIKRK